MSLTPEQQALSEPLTKLQRLIVLGMVGGKTQRQAYYDAGGKAKNDNTADASVSEILGNPRVDAFYKSMIAQVANTAIMTREEALERLSLIGRTHITDILEFRTVAVSTIGEDGEPSTADETIWLMKDSPDVEQRAAAAIKSVTLTKQGPKIEMYDARDAIAQISKMQGWDAAQKVDNTHRIIDDGSNEW